jgi:hypothetical protein
MKKLVLISTLVATFAGVSAFGQGYFLFTSSKSTVYNGFTGGAAALNTAVNTAFLWSADTTATAKVAEYGTSVASSTTVATSTYSAANAWADILTDANFTLAVNAANSQVAVMRTTSAGAINYNAGAVFAITGTTAGTAVRVFEIGWNGAYATPSLASAAVNDGYVGWGQAFNYTPTVFTATANNMPSVAFGVAGIIPEPSTIALAGLGALSLLAFRRRK